MVLDTCNLAGNYVKAENTFQEIAKASSELSNAAIVAGKYVVNAYSNNPTLFAETVIAISSPVGAGVVLVAKLPIIIDSINAYLGLVESLDSKVKKLLHSELNSAIRFYDQASKAQKQEQSIQLINDARVCFTKALDLEEEERLATTYIGLAVCQAQLEDWRNAQATLEEFASGKIKIKSIAGAISNLSGIDDLRENAKRFTSLMGGNFRSLSIPTQSLSLNRGREDVFVKSFDSITVSDRQRKIFELQAEAFDIAQKIA
jgi:tetratricopeptide (TPR) repeat protein